MAHRQHLIAWHTISTYKPPRRLKVVACHRNTSARQSLAPQALALPPACLDRTTPARMHVARTQGPSEPPAPCRARTQPAFSTLALRPRPKRCYPRYSARAGSAVRPSTRQRARRDRLDARLAPPPPSIAPSRAEARATLLPAPPPCRQTGMEAPRAHAPADRPPSTPWSATDAQRRHSVVTHTPSPCMHVCVHRSAPPF